MEDGRTPPTGVIPHQSTPISSLPPLGSFSDSQGGQYIEPRRDASQLHTPAAPMYTDLVNVVPGGQGLTYEQWRDASRTPTPTQVVQTLHSPAPNDGKDSQDDQSGDGVV